MFKYNPALDNETTTDHLLESLKMGTPLTPIMTLSDLENQQLDKLVEQGILKHSDLDGLSLNLKKLLCTDAFYHDLLKFNCKITSFDSSKEHNPNYWLDSNKLQALENPLLIQFIKEKHIPNEDNSESFFHFMSTDNNERWNFVNQLPQVWEKNSFEHHLIFFKIMMLFPTIRQLLLSEAHVKIIRQNPTLRWDSFLHELSHCYAEYYWTQRKKNPDLQTDKSDCDSKIQHFKSIRKTRNLNLDIRTYHDIPSPSSFLNLCTHFQKPIHSKKRAFPVTEGPLDRFLNPNFFPTTPTKKTRIDQSLTPLYHRVPLAEAATPVSVESTLGEVPRLERKNALKQFSME